MFSGCMEEEKNVEKQQERKRKVKNANSTEFIRMFMGLDSV